MQKTTTYLKATLLAITLVLGSAYVSAWTAPVSDPPGGSVALPVNTGSNSQVKTGDFAVWNLTTNNIYSNGNVGIGIASPSAKLEVSGGPIKATGGLIIETRTSDPASPSVGQMWLRTDL